MVKGIAYNRVTMKRILLSVALIAATLISRANQDSTYIVSKDTIKVSGVEIVSVTSKAGKESVKALYMSRKYSITKKDAEAINSGATPYIIYNNYNNGERKISKITSR